jgi:hypothetical protein
MVKARLAILLIGLGVGQAFTSDEDRDRHWAEGVYFPRATTRSTTQNYSPSIESDRVQQIRRKRWPDENYYGSAPQYHTPQSFGYPVQGYHPYQPSVTGVNGSFSGPKSEYVPQNYSLNAPLKKHEENRNGYRAMNGFSPRQNHYRDEYRSDMNVYTEKYTADLRREDYCKPNYNLVDADRHGGGYGQLRGLYGSPDFMALGYSGNLDIPYYNHFLSDIPYHPDWNSSLLVNEPRILQNPWEFLWPLSNSVLPHYPIW